MRTTSASARGTSYQRGDDHIHCASDLGVLHLNVCRSIRLSDQASLEDCQQPHTDQLTRTSYQLIWGSLQIGLRSSFVLPERE